MLQAYPVSQTMLSPAIYLHIIMANIVIHIGYRDSADNTVEENSSMFSLI